jgi:hypothetical protein
LNKRQYKQKGLKKYLKLLVHKEAIEESNKGLLPDLSFGLLVKVVIPIMNVSQNSN